MRCCGSPSRRARQRWPAQRARLTYLDAQVKRLQKLVSQNTATRSRLDEAVAERDVTRSELSAARARVALTAERLERTRIKAPFGGIVTERVLQSGEWAESGRAVVRLVDAGALEVQTWIPIAALAFVRGRTASLLSWRSSPSKTTSATVRTIVPVGDNRSRLYELRLGVGRPSPGRSGRTCGWQSRPPPRAPSSPFPATRWCCAVTGPPSTASDDQRPCRPGRGHPGNRPGRAHRGRRHRARRSRGDPRRRAAAPRAAGEGR